MKYRKFRGTDLEVSEVGLWTISTGWWGDHTDEEAVRLMRLARDLGGTLFDAADTYGNGRSEGLIAKAFADRHTASVLPNIYNEDQLREFAAAPDKPMPTPDELRRIAELVASHFGLEPEEGKFKGTMVLPEEVPA